MKKAASLFSLVVLFGITVKAQLTQPFSIVEFADNYTLVLGGDENATFTLKWTDASLHKPGTVLNYSVQYDSIGSDFSNPAILIGASCCGNFFKDTTVQISYKYLAGELNALSLKRLKKPFSIGESMTLDWNIIAIASGPNATYDNRGATSRRITIVRGQFDNEYVPVKLNIPLDNSSFFVEDNDVVKLKFQWTKAYCPAGCAAPQYTIMFDNVNGDFTNPLYLFKIPQSPFDTIYDLRQDVLTQMMYDDGVAVNVPKTYKWAINVEGNGQDITTPGRRISLLRGLMKFEHIPFRTLKPIDNAVFKLEKNKQDSVIFVWNSTRTGYPDVPKYNILFDTTGPNPNFTNPLFKLSTTVGDTDYIARFIELRDTLDRKYGKKWNSAKLKWTVEADVIGFKHLAQDTNDMIIARGFFTGINEVEKTALLVYPNPAGNEIHIIAPVAITNFRLTDIAGREMQVNTAGLNEGIINVSSLANGIYYIVAIDKNGISLPPCRFIKQ